MRSKCRGDARSELLGGIECTSDDDCDCSLFGHRHGFVICLQKDSRWVASRVTGHYVYVKMWHVLSGVNTVVLKNVKARCGESAYQSPSEEGGLDMNRAHND